LLVGREDLDAVEPVAAPGEADERIGRVERQPITREALVELRELRRPAVVAEGADVVVST
jgi:hypothetical protein